MNTLRISRVVGFGTKPPQDFDQSPVTFGTASSSSIRFDAAFDRGVAPQHARLEWNGEAWYLLDGGTPGGTWVDGRRLAEALRIDATVEFSFGEQGPKVRVETLAPAAPMSVPIAHMSAPQTQSAKTPTASSGISPVMVKVVGLLLLLLVVGFGAFTLLPWKGGKRPGFDTVLNDSGETGTPVQQIEQVVEDEPAQVSASQHQEEPPPQQTASQEQKSEVPTIPESIRPEVESLKEEPFYKALKEFWQSSKSRSPYVKAILKNEDFWLATQVPWLNRYQQSGGESTGRGMDFPGAFVPEAIYSDAELLGIPMASPDVAAVVGLAVAENSPSGGNGRMAALGSTPSLRSALRSSPPSKSALANRFRSFASTGSSRQSDLPKAYGLFVGINGFQDPGANLVGCRNDVGSQAKVLASQGIFSPDSIRLLTDTRKDTPDYPSKANVLAALSETVAKAGANDVIYLTFSTHGMYDSKAKDSALLMADMNLLYGRELTEILSNAKAKNILITMDACQTGGMVSIGGSQYAAKTKSAPIPESFYEVLASSRGHVVIRACRSDQSTPDIRPLGHGLLCAILISGLTGDADANGDGIVTLSELRIYATTAIPTISRRAIELGSDISEDPLQATFTSSSFGEAGDLPLTVVEKHPIENHD